ncbi:MAG: TIGR02757 family protein [Spirochaetales bacterium]|nr:TIGR02757 family protein [Spirochaetales bacterium]MCF7937033.1 TIGR02757 family protein [Spirochaetales bacterium]
MNEAVRFFIEEVYTRYHHPRYISPDPLELLSPYKNAGDREIAAFIAAALALGRVDQIVLNVRELLERLGPPRRTLEKSSLDSLRRRFEGFRYRFFRGEQIAGLFSALSGVIGEYGSLNTAFLSDFRCSTGSINDALKRFVLRIRAAAKIDLGILVPDPALGSACKRLHLYLRWMVRSDRVDPGGWTGLSPKDLIVPVDTHILRSARMLGLTARKTADVRTAGEITSSFRTIDPDDPVRFDFSLSRLGIFPGLPGIGELWKEARGAA